MTAAQDLARKLRLEATFTAALDQFHRRVVTRFVQELAQTGATTGAQPWVTPLQGLLLAHYLAVAKVFNGTLGQRLPAAVAPTTAEEQLIAATLGRYWVTTAADHAVELTATTSTNMQEALAAARAEEDQSLGGIAALAAAGLHRALRGRLTTIAVTETQLAAETTKATEAEILSGVLPSIEGGQPRASEILKRWDSRGDSIVRPSHVLADGQVVPVNQPFIVGGERLMFPGDRSLGASTKNVINCRCSAVYDERLIIDRRQGG